MAIATTFLSLTFAHCLGDFSSQTAPSYPPPLQNVQPSWNSVRFGKFDEISKTRLEMATTSCCIVVDACTIAAPAVANPIFSQFQMYSSPFYARRFHSQNQRFDHTNFVEPFAAAAEHSPWLKALAGSVAVAAAAVPVDGVVIDAGPRLILLVLDEASARLHSTPGGRSSPLATFAESPSVLAVR